METDVSPETERGAGRDPPRRTDVEGRGVHRDTSGRAASALLVSAVLLTVVWAFPLVLAFAAMTDPVAVYQESPAEARESFGGMVASDQAYISTLIRVGGAVVALVAAAGLYLTWGPLRRGQPSAFAVASLAALGVVGIAAWLHMEGFWTLYPVWGPGLAWLFAVGAGLVGFAMMRQREAPSRANRGRPMG